MKVVIFLVAVVTVFFFGVIVPQVTKNNTASSVREEIRASDTPENICAAKVRAQYDTLHAWFYRDVSRNDIGQMASIIVLSRGPC